MFGDPVFKMLVRDLVRTEDGALFGVHTHGNKVG
jgi:hypothetical protein